MGKTRNPYHIKSGVDGGRFTTGGGGGDLNKTEKAARVAAGLRADVMGNTLIGKLEAGGFSESLAGKSPKTGYMTATTTKTEKVIAIDKLTKKDITQYALAHNAELSEPDTYLGGWLDTDEDSGITSAYLDVPTNFQSMDETVKVARAASQIGIYDVINDRTIFVNEGRLYYEVGKPKTKVYL